MEEWNPPAVTADDEASSLAEIFWIADRVPESDGHHIQELARSYARVVVNEEWPLMEQEKSSPRAWDLLDDMRASLHLLAYPLNARNCFLVTTLVGVAQASSSLPSPP